MGNDYGMMINTHEIYQILLRGWALLPSNDTFMTMKYVFQSHMGIKTNDLVRKLRF